MRKLMGRRIAVLVCDGFEQVELFDARTALEDEGARVDVISPGRGRVKGWKSGDWGKRIKPDVPLEMADPVDYDALFLPGGVINADKLRVLPEAIRFIRAFIESDKPIASICHAPWALINAGFVRGKRMTSWPSLEMDLRNAGANWVDEEVVRDAKLVTSRRPADLRAFNEMMIALFAEQAPVARPAAELRA
jgi:protease I